MVIFVNVVVQLYLQGTGGKDRELDSVQYMEAIAPLHEMEKSRFHLCEVAYF